MGVGVGVHVSVSLCTYVYVLVLCVCVYVHVFVYGMCLRTCVCMCVCMYVCVRTCILQLYNIYVYLYIQWNLSIKDTFGPVNMSTVERFSTIQRCKMYYHYRIVYFQCLRKCPL